MMATRFSRRTSFSALKQLFQWTGLSRVVHEGHWIKRFMRQSTSYQSSLEQNYNGPHVQTQTNSFSQKHTLVLSVLARWEDYCRCFFSTKAEIYTLAAVWAFVRLRQRVASHQDLNVMTYNRTCKHVASLHESRNSSVSTKWLQFVTSQVWCSLLRLSVMINVPSLKQLRSSLNIFNRGKNTISQTIIQPQLQKNLLCFPHIYFTWATVDVPGWAA